MKCNEFLRHLGQMLDSECDPETHLAVSQHLQTCKSCADRLSKETRLENRMKLALTAASDTDGSMWDRLEKNIGSPKPQRFSRILLAAVAAVFIAIIGLVTYISQPEKFDLAKVAYKDHIKWSQDDHRKTLFNSAWQDIPATLHGHLPFDITLTQSQPDGMELAGVRACTIGKTPVALLIGDYEKKPVSLFIFPDHDLSLFPGAQEAMNRNQGAFHCQQDAVRIYAVHHDDKVVCVTGELEHSKLESLAVAVLNQLEISKE